MSDAIFWIAPESSSDFLENDVITKILCVILI